METTSAYYNLTNLSNTCSTEWDPYLLIRDQNAIIVITAFLSVISTFTVLANCIIIIAISRAYFCGISSPVSSKSSRLSAPNMIKRWRSYVIKREDTSGGFHQPVMPEISSVSGSISTVFSSESESQLSTGSTEQGIHLLQVKDTHSGLSNGNLLTVVKREPDSDATLKNTSSSFRSVNLISDMPAVTELFTLSGNDNTAKLNTNSSTTPTEHSVTSVDARPSFQAAKTLSDTDMSIGSPSMAARGRMSRVPTLTARSTYTDTVPRPCRRIRLTNRASNIPIVLMFSMAVSDVMLAAVIMPLSTIELYHNGNWPFGSLSCEIRMTLDVVLSTTSIYHVTCMAADRYLAICRPFLHRKLSVRMGVVAVGACWALPVAMISFFYIPQAASITVINAFPPNCSDLDQMNFPDNTDVSSTPNTDTNIIPYPSQKLEICVQSLTVALMAVAVTVAFYIPFIIIVVLYTLVLVEVRKFLKGQTILQSGTKSPRPGKVTFQTVVNLAVTDLAEAAGHPSVDTHHTEVLTVSEGLTKYPSNNQNSKSSCAVEDPVDYRQTELLASKAIIQSGSTQTETCQPQTENPYPVSIVQTCEDLKWLPSEEFYKGGGLESTMTVESKLHTSGEQSIVEKINRGKKLDQYACSNHHSTEFEASGTSSVKNRIISSRCGIASSAKIKGKIASKTETKAVKNLKASQKTLKAVKTIGLVVVCFTICWLPFSIFVLFLTVTEEDVSYWTVVLITWLGYVNSSLNPILYCGHWMVRAALRDLFCMGTRQNS